MPVPRLTVTLRHDGELDKELTSRVGADGLQQLQDLLAEVTNALARQHLTTIPRSRLAGQYPKNRES
jgi:hypothetical protein